LWYNWSASPLSICELYVTESGLYASNATPQCAATTAAPNYVPIITVKNPCNYFVGNNMDGVSNVQITSRTHKNFKGLDVVRLHDCSLSFSAAEVVVEALSVLEMRKRRVQTSSQWFSARNPVLACKIATYRTQKLAQSSSL
jgi:hypothetical protein